MLRILHLPSVFAYINCIFHHGPGRKYYHDSHFLERETEAQSAWLTCSLSWARKQEEAETGNLLPGAFPTGSGLPLSAELGCEGDTLTPPSRCCGACVTLSGRVRVEAGVIPPSGPGYKDTGLCGFSIGSLGPPSKKLRAFAGTWPGQPPSPESREGSGDLGELCERGSVKAQQWPHENQRQKELGSRVSALGPPRPSHLSLKRLPSSNSRLHLAAGRPG